MCGHVAQLPSECCSEMFCSAFQSESMLSCISFLVRNRSARRRNLPCKECKHRWKHGEALFKVKGINLLKILNIWGSERAGGELTQERTPVLKEGCLWRGHKL